MPNTLNASNVWYTGDLKKEREEQRKSNPLSTAYDNWAKEPDVEANQTALLQKLQPTIDAALTSYAPNNKSALQTKARIIAMTAVKSYDPKRKVQLNTYVSNALKSLNRENAKRTNMVHVPENVLLEKNKIQKATDSFMADYGREPNMVELADLSGLSIKRIAHVRKYDPQKAESQMLTEKGDTFFTKSSDPQKIWADYVYYDLDPIDKKIFEWLTGHGGTDIISKRDIAKRLKISSPAVSQRVNKIIKMMEQGHNV